ncbi:MAG: DUF4435 domain-containing protein [Thermoflexibacter sp.]|jgi:hypothetical protein|nr:DUF4435 domain-containing protein [Thermoflexibacter sp.]
MDLKQTQQSKKNKATVAFHRFSLHLTRFAGDLFCFFEGKGDSYYYVPRIKAYYSGNYHSIDCKGRESVIDVYKMINHRPEYVKYKKAFFIDRDFNLPLNKFDYPLIYETPCYSIENMYVSDKVFKEILKNEFYLSELDSEYDNCIAWYLERQNEFHEAVLLFNAWYACLIDLRNEKGLNTNVNLEDSFPKDFIVFSLQNISKNYDLAKIQAKFPNTPIIDQETLDAKVAFFDSISTKYKIFRGKYEIEFLVKMLNYIISDSVNTQSLIKKHIKYTLVGTQILSQFTQYAETPSDLIAYIKDIIKTN